MEGMPFVAMNVRTRVLNLSTLDYLDTGETLRS
jgi:hypothetical protein